MRKWQLFCPTNSAINKQHKFKPFKKIVKVKIPHLWNCTKPHVTTIPDLLYAVRTTSQCKPKTFRPNSSIHHPFLPLTGDSPNRQVPVPPASREHDVSAVSVQLMKKSGLSLKTHAGGHNWIATRLQFSLLLKPLLHDRMQN